MKRGSSLRDFWVKPMGTQLARTNFKSFRQTLWVLSSVFSVFTSQGSEVGLLPLSACADCPSLI